MAWREDAIFTNATVKGHLTVGGATISSLAQPYAGLYFTTPAATTLPDDGGGTYVKAAGTTTLTSASSHFTMPANNRLPACADRLCVTVRNGGDVADVRATVEC